MERPLLEELNRRRVFRALVGYGIAAFALLQIIEPIMHGLHWPDVVLSYVVVALALGFPLVVVLAWVFDVNAGRIERTGPAKGISGLRLAAILAGLGVLAAAPGVAYWFLLRHPEAHTAAGPPSVAVLPFVNMSGDKENEYFSEGITEELINALANVEGLRVASRTAVYGLKDKSDIGQIGAQLKVTTLLEGSVRREGNALRVTAQLINVSDGYHLWSQTYDRELKGIFALYDEIARSIAQALRRKLVHDEGVKQPTSDLEAHDLYLKGRYFWFKRTLEDFRTAENYFQQAIEKDPGYALAWTGLADAIALRMDYDSVPTTEVAGKARAAAERALQIDPGLAEAHCSLGNIAWHQLEWSTAERELRAAIALEPDNATAHQWLAEALGNLGRFDEATAEIGRALAADPGALIVNAVAGRIRYWHRDPAGAIEEYRRTLAMDPSFLLAHYLRAYAYDQQARYEEAAADLGKLGAYPRSFVLPVAALVDAHRGRRAEALRELAELEELSRRGYVLPSFLAQVQVALGDRRKALALLQKACAELDNGMLTLKVDPIWDPIRKERGYPELLACAHLQ